MAVRRIVADLFAADPSALAGFYKAVFDLEIAMDFGWIATMAGEERLMKPQLSLANQGGAGTPPPALSIEVDDLDEALARAKDAGAAIEYGPVTEDWGVTRFFLRDPAGNLVNVLTH